MTDIYIVDDEKDIRSLLTGFLEDEGYNVRSAPCSASFFELLKGRLPDLALLDIWLKNSPMDGMEILMQLRESHPEIPVIMISGHGSIETAVHALKIGAYDFLEKPIKIDCLTAALRRALEISALRRENNLLKDVTVSAPSAFQGEGSAVKELRNALAKHANGNSRVFITGKPGAGKEIAARAIHAASKRADAPFVVFSASGMSFEEADKKLFGYFDKTRSDAPARSGLLETAHRGSIFLDEVSEYPLPLQQKITRFLTEGLFARNGRSEKTVASDVRFIAATALDPQEAIANGVLSGDFYQRLSLSKVRVPSLLERREDIIILVRHFAADAAREYGVVTPDFSEEALICLQTYTWPGNVRQLKNAIEHIVMLRRDHKMSEKIEVSDLPKEIRDTGPPVLQTAGRDKLIDLNLREAREAFEREYLLAQLIRFRGNVSRTAAFVGMERSALHRKLKSLGVTETKYAPEKSEEPA